MTAFKRKLYCLWLFYFSVSETQSSAPQSHQHHRVQPFLLWTRRLLHFFLQTRKKLTPKNNDSRPQHHLHLGHHHSPSHLLSWYTGDPFSKTSSGGSEACDAGSSSCSLPELLPSPEQTNRIQAERQQVENPRYDWTPGPLWWWTVQRPYNEITSPVLSC